jgi:hypothetical protein
MTDVIERRDVAVAEPVPTLGRERTRSERPPTGVDGGAPRIHGAVPILLAITMGAQAILLFSVASGHLTGAEATVATVAAVIEIIGAVLVVTRPQRRLSVVAVVVNATMIVFWPVVQGSGGPSATTTAIGAGLAALATVVAAVLAVRPTAGQRWDSSTAVFGSVIPVAVAVVTVVALFATPAATAAPTTSASSPTTAGARAAELALSGTVRVPGESSKTFQSIVAGNDTEQSELKKWVPLDAPDQAILTSELSGAYQAAERFPTVAAAKKAGLILAGGMAPGVGAHYQDIGAGVLKGINPNGTVNPAYPASWIYAGTGDSSPVVGVMYVSMTDKAPQGFIGPNDHWHRHSNVCVQFRGGKIGVPFAADQNVTPQECADVHGSFMKKTVWMVHAWVVPGWESPQGVFSHDNLHVYCPGNTDLTDAIGFCDRQS